MPREQHIAERMGERSARGGVRGCAPRGKGGTWRVTTLHAAQRPSSRNTTAKGDSKNVISMILSFSTPQVHSLVYPVVDRL